MEAAEPFDFSNTSNTLISSNDAPNFIRYPFVFGFKTKWTENHHDIGIASLIRQLRPPVVGLGRPDRLEAASMACRARLHRMAIVQTMDSAVA